MLKESFWGKVIKKDKKKVARSPKKVSSKKTSPKKASSTKDSPIKVETLNDNDDFEPKIIKKIKVATVID